MFSLSMTSMELKNLIFREIDPTSIIGFFKKEGSEKG